MTYLSYGCNESEIYTFRTSVYDVTTIACDTSDEVDLIDLDFWCFNATFRNISAISWRPVLVVEEAGILGENHRPWASNW